ncbi:MAG TPA: HAD hydrolase family protein, partial [Erysipelotrichaceae bacterium]|nr:HAD hydrolase family protein [Erysipelotrichaceae bacterium]
GDSQNDMEMLKGSTLSVAMGNADPKLKDIAMIITDDVDKDGIFNALNKLGYIKK